jgi:hypothetical protein
VPVTWSERTDRILGGDLTAALAYLTPAGGAVVTAVAPLGLRDRERGELTFTTSLGFGKKLERIRRDPRIALLYHAREHGFHRGDELVLVQGTARVVDEPDPKYLARVVGPAVVQYLGMPRSGVFWDRWLAAYNADRVPVHVDVERIVTWPSLAGAGEPEVEGAPWPDAPPEPQAPPRNGTAPRVDVERAAKRCAGLPHVLLAWRGADGFPVCVPLTSATAVPRGLAVTAQVPLPGGGRRAGLLAHAYEPQLVGLESRQYTGWLDGDVYAPHTETGYRAPKNKTLLLLANGYMARRGLKKARAQGAL